MDATTRLLLEDAQAQGLSIGEYERKYGVIIEGTRFPNAAEARIRRNETHGGLMSDSDYARAAHKEKRRGVPRR